MEINGVDQSNQMMSMLGMGKIKPPDPSEIGSAIVSALDTDGDGVIGAEELAAAGQIGEKISLADTNGDGVVTSDELVAKITARMQEMGIGVMESGGESLDLNALKEILAKVGLEGPGKEQKPDPAEISSKIISDLDTNGDGVISAEELEAAGLFGQKIAEADTDGNGSVSQEELENYVAENAPPPPPAGREDSEEEKQTGYELIGRTLEEVFGFSSDERNGFLKMLENYPFKTTC